MARYTVGGGYPNPDPYYASPEESAEVEAEADRRNIRNAAIEECVNEITASWGADLLTTVQALRALKEAIRET